MAIDKATAPDGLCWVLNGWVSYERHDWGDWIVGRKAQLQALGLRPGLPYPGEPGAPRKLIRTTDPRGFPVELTPRRAGPGLFQARVVFADRPPRPDRDNAERPLGALRFSQGWWYDAYAGTADALVAAGLVQREHLPGAPGMRLHRVTIAADGAPVAGHPNANTPAMKAPGARWVERRGKSFRVVVRVSADESARRVEAERQAVWMWEQHVRSLPQPARLDELAPARATPLRLVASTAPSALPAPVGERPRPALRLVATTRGL